MYLIVSKTGKISNKEFKTHIFQFFQCLLLISAEMPYQAGVKQKEYFKNVVIKLCHVFGGNWWMKQIVVSDVVCSACVQISTHPLNSIKQEKKSDEWQLKMTPTTIVERHDMFNMVDARRYWSRKISLNVSRGSFMGVWS